MKTWVCWIGLCAIAAFAGISCGDSETSTGSGGAGGTGGSGGAGGSDGGMCDPDASKSTTVICVTANDCDKLAPYTGPTPPVYTCNGSKSSKYPDGPNACRNDSDCEIINTGLVRDIVRTIALSCRSYEPDPNAPEAERITKCKAEADCNTAEVKKETARQIKEPGLTDACGQCYTQVALCSIAFCLSDCAANADAPGCVKCQFEQGCRLPYERCSGLDRQE